MHVTLNDLAYSVFPSQAVYFSVVREPSEAFESLYNYYDFGKSFGMSMAEYIRK